MPTLVVLAVVNSFVCVVPGAAMGHPGLHHDIEGVSAQLAEEPDRFDLLVLRAHYYRLNGELVEALADLDRAGVLAPSDAGVLLGRGLTLVALRRDDEAEKVLTDLLAQGNPSFEGYAARGDIRRRLGRVGGALEDFSAALNIKDDIDTYIERAELQSRLGMIDEAAAGLRVALDRCHGAVTVRQPLIKLETQLGNYDAALQLINEALKSVNVKTDWYLSRATVYEASGNNARAVAERHRALEEVNRALAQNRSGIQLYSRARVYLALGEVENARRDLETTLRISPRFSRASELLERMGE